MLTSISRFRTAAAVFGFLSQVWPACAGSSQSEFPHSIAEALPPGIRGFDLTHPLQRGPSTNPGVTSPLAPQPPDKPQPKSAPKTHAQLLDELFGRLATAQDSDEASGVAIAIQHLWLQSGSDTADLLMNRAASAAAKGDHGLALQLLDKIVLLDPNWAEAWNKRATVHFLDDDDADSMADIGHVLSLEPRHFGALTGMASILLRTGMKKEALAVLRRTASIYPHNTDIDAMIEQLVPEVEGRPI
jgi:tetratricopeptide (TPR) repeat protein